MQEKVRRKRRPALVTDSVGAAAYCALRSVVLSLQEAERVKAAETGLACVFKTAEAGAPFTFNFS